MTAAWRLRGGCVAASSGAGAVHNHRCPRASLISSPPSRQSRYACRLQAIPSTPSRYTAVTPPLWLSPHPRMRPLRQASLAMGFASIKARTYLPLWLLMVVAYICEVRMRERPAPHHPDRSPPTSSSHPPHHPTLLTIPAFPALGSALGSTRTPTLPPRSPRAAHRLPDGAQAQAVPLQRSGAPPSLRRPRCAANLS